MTPGITISVAVTAGAALMCWFLLGVFMVPPIVGEQMPALERGLLAK
jgi:hypothetical protein